MKRMPLYEPRARLARPRRDTACTAWVAQPDWLVLAILEQAAW